ncbi:MAG: FMN-dependent NADH-azoreductase [Arenicellales bacterium]|nr:FMN-dependent NADH-azoreductase [Arenicellales bacterium]
MKKILYIKSSLSGEQSVSSQLSDKLIQRLSSRYPGSKVTTLDLARNPPPHLNADEFSAWSVAESERSMSQRRLASRSDALIEQLLAHDILVLAVPMYNLGVPSTLKAWIDRVARAGKTFRYTAEGPEGLINDMKAYLIFARGGVYRNTALDTQTGYLRNVLGLMGIIDIETIHAEGLNIGDDIRDASLTLAHDNIQTLVTDRKPEVHHAAA